MGPPVSNGSELMAGVAFEGSVTGGGGCGSGGFGWTRVGRVSVGLELPCALVSHCGEKGGPGLWGRSSEKQSLG